MAQETVIHRVDAELGAGASIAPIPADLAADGIDELLVAFVEFGTTTWPDEFTEHAGRCGRPDGPGAYGGTVLAAAPGQQGRTGRNSPMWTVRTRRSAARPAEVLRWLWQPGR